ncbi:MAG: hypothetical protein EOO90_16975 [Pedobacter sp.]|nr:MAG: hypothetical protein EOO90_16975 [Pedobacter sp.]
MQESDSQALFSATAVSTTILCVNLITIYLFTNYFGLTLVVTNKLIIVSFMVAVGYVNHYFFVRERRFLRYDFQKDRKGGFLIVAYIIFTFMLALIVGKYNREKIFKERAGELRNVPRRESLEGKIKKWFE